MKEYYVHRSISLSSSTGVVHLELEVDDWNEESRIVMLEYNALELLKDLPSLYEFAKRGNKKEQEYIAERIKDLKKDLDKDFKRPVGRPPKD